MENIGIILLAGSSTRLKNDISIKKQFYKINNKEVFLYSLETFIKSNLFSKIYLTIDKNDEKLVNDILRKENYKFPIEIIYGGNSRLESTYNSLLRIKKDNKDCFVYIHDGARPLVSIDLLNKLNTASQTSKAVIPYLDIYNSIYDISKNCYANRKDFIQIQTPQVFDFNLLFRCYNNIDLLNNSFLDEGSVLKYNNEEINFIKGETINIKLTDLSTLKIIERLLK